MFADIVLAGGIGLYCGYVIYRQIKNRKNPKAGCSGCCSSCHGCSHAEPYNPKKQT